MPHYYARDSSSSTQLRGCRYRLQPLRGVAALLSGTSWGSKSRSTSRSLRRSRWAAKLAPRPFRQVRLKAGETLIKLMEIEEPPPRRGSDFAAGVRWLTFFVDDARKTYEDLSAKGVEFSC